MSVRYVTLPSDTFRMRLTRPAYLLSFILVVLMNSPTVQAQLERYEDSLKAYSLVMRTGKNDFDRYKAAEQFSKCLINALSKSKSFDYTFDSVRSLSVLYPDDRSFRILTWAIPRKDNSFEHAGMIQLADRKSEKGAVIQLSDPGTEMTDPAIQILDPNHWMGAYYYKIIQHDYNGKR